MIKIELESGIPIPPRAHRVATKRSSVVVRYPWSQMDISDSFFVPLPEGRAIRQHQINLQVAAKQSRRNFKKRKYVTRIAFHRGQRGVRVWRVE